MIRLEITRGTSGDFLIQCANRSDGSPPSAGDFLSSDTLAATVSIGEGHPSLFAPTVSWTTGDADPDTGLFHLSVSNANTDLEAGDYLLIVSNARGGRTGIIAKGQLRILGAVGTGTAPKVYCTYQDLKDELPWIDELKDESSDLMGFAKQRGQARDWFDGLVLSAQPRGWGLDSSHEGYWTWDFSRGSASYGASGNGFAEDPVVRGYLDDDLLIITGPYGRRIVDACTYWTLASILRRTAIQKPGMSMGNLASYYAKKADNAAIGCVAQIDTNEDGTPDIAITLGITNTRYA